MTNMITSSMDLMQQCATVEISTDVESAATETQHIVLHGTATRSQLIEPYLRLVIDGSRHGLLQAAEAEGVLGALPPGPLLKAAPREHVSTPLSGRTWLRRESRAFDLFSLLVQMPMGTVKPWPEYFSIGRPPVTEETESPNGQHMLTNAICSLCSTVDAVHGSSAMTSMLYRFRSGRAAIRSLRPCRKCWEMHAVA